MMDERKKKRRERGSFFRDGLSIDETRMSVLIIVFLVGSCFSFFQVVKLGDLSGNLLSLIMYLIMAISGINISESVMKGIGRRSSMRRTDVGYDVMSEDSGELEESAEEVPVGSNVAQSGTQG